MFLGLLVLAARSQSGPTLLPPQSVVLSRSTTQDASDVCSTCPEMRTLISILWSCFSTLVLATWVSVHPNVPPPRTSFFRIAITRFGLMVATMLAPELIFLWAYDQRRQAGKIHSNPRFRDKGRSWTRTHGFYLLMGGFVLYQGEDRYGALTEARLESLLERGFVDLPEIEEEEILDKSKGDWVAKTIAVIQLLWFAAQLVARYVKGWATTELEILTLSTAIMTVGMHICWWDKPLDIRCQTKVYLKVNADVFFEAPVLTRALPIQELQAKPSFFRRLFTDPVVVTEDNTTVTHRASHWVYRNLFQSRFSPKKITIILFLPLVLLYALFVTVDKDTRDLEQPAATAGATDSRTEDFVHQQPQSIVESPFQTARLPLRAWRDTVFMFSGESETTRLRKFLFSFVNLVFGGLHLLAWPAKMPTSAEVTIWRFAAIYLTSYPFFALLVLLIPFQILDKDFEKTLWHNVIKGPVVIGAMFHPLVRAMVIIDALALLRKLPDTAYRDLAWSDVIPSL